MQYKSQRFSSQLLTSAAIFKAEAKLAKSDDVASAKRSIEIIMSHSFWVEYNSILLAFYFDFSFKKVTEIHISIFSTCFVIFGGLIFEICKVDKIDNKNIDSFQKYFFTYFCHFGVNLGLRIAKLKKKQQKYWFFYIFLSYFATLQFFWVNFLIVYIWPYIILTFLLLIPIWSYTYSRLFWSELANILSCKILFSL